MLPRLRAPLLVLVALLLGTPALAQRRISGTVVDPLGSPLARAQVSLVGTALAAVTDGEGRFEIPSAPATPVRLRVSLIGYRPAQVGVEAGTSDVRITLERAPVTLEEVVVTGTAGGAEKRAVANAVSQVRAEVVEMAAVANVGQLLNARATGVTISTPSGNPGGGQNILIRGRSSISLPTTPLIYVDGVRVDNRPSTGGQGPGSAARLNDFSPEQIESIEVIKGPAAATLYGTEASNGVIQIITKKGRPGAAQVGVSIRQGAQWFNDPEGRWLINYYRDPATTQVIEYNLAQQESDRGTPLFRTGHVQGYAVDLSGGSELVRYFAAADYNREQGATRTGLHEQWGTRLNLDATPSEKWNANAQFGLAMLRTEFANPGFMFSAVLSRPSTRDTPRRGFFTAPTETYESQSEQRRNVNHATLGVEVEHRPLVWFNQRLRTGVDFSNDGVVLLTRRMPPEHAQFFSAGVAAGSKTYNQTNVLTTTVDYTATATLPSAGDMQFATTGGFQYYRANTTLLGASGLVFPAHDITSIAGAATRLGSDDAIENVTVGVFMQEQISFKNRLFLTGAIRGDDNSAFGQSFDLVTYPKVSASWVVSEEPFWNVDFVDALRLRAAWGKSGQQPQAFAALRTFEPITGQAGAAGVTPQFVGNDSLGPEKAQELELGVDAALFDQRLAIEFTFYQQNTKDAIILRDVAPSSGFPQQQFVNAGEVRNRGLEVAVNASVIEASKANWNLGFNFSTNDNEVVRLGILGTPFLQFGFGNRFQPGYPVNAIFSRKVVSADRDANGRPINIKCDGGLPDGMPGGPPVDCATAPRVFTGRVDPNVQASVISSLRLFGRLTLSGLLDLKGGNKVWTSTLWCPGILDCEEEVFPERFDAVKAASSVLGYVDDWEWWRDVSFAKLRELSVAYQMPDSWARSFGASRAQLSLAGRNLHTWTGFQGLDPENAANYPVAGTPFEQNEIPQLRQFFVKLNVTF